MQVFACCGPKVVKGYDDYTATDNDHTQMIAEQVWDMLTVLVCCVKYLLGDCYCLRTFARRILAVTSFCSGPREECRRWLRLHTWRCEKVCLDFRHL
jgi:hypothetical protein